MIIINREYNASLTCTKFHIDDAFIRGLVGPIGSGKSVACCAELMKLAQAQLPGPDGQRRSRWAIIRNTYRELQDTTLRTWFDWFPRELGVWRAGDMEHIIKIGDFEATFMFRALDRPDDIKKLLSLELTGAWINEAREIPKAVLDMLQGRVGRFPSKRDGGPTWSGIIMDTNPPDSDHGWYRLFEEDRPDGWSIYHQPGGMSETAENVENLPPNYYSRLQGGHDQAWIDVYVHGKYGFVKDGKPVYPEFADAVHVLEQPPEKLMPKHGKEATIYAGVDFGLTPAATFAQLTPGGQWQFLSEVVTEDMGAVRFAGVMLQHMQEHYPYAKFKVWGDPAGDDRAQTDEKTPMMILRARGIPIIPAPSNDPIIRRETVATTMTTLTMGGTPRLVVSPDCKQLRKALAGGYKYRRLQVSGEEKYVDKPDKNRYSHVAESQQYLLVGAGEARGLVQKSQNLGRQFKAKGTIGRRKLRASA